MPETTSSSTAVDLSRLPAPTVIEQRAFETIRAEMIADFRARYPEYDAELESDPIVKLLETAAYRELLLRQTFNDRALQLFTAYATGANLDHLGALVGVGRLVIDPGDPGQGVDPTYEDDASLRQRIVLAPESWSVAGPELAYVFHAKSASADVLDASATSPAPGEVLISLLSRTGDGTAPAATIAAVEAVLATVEGNALRPLGDLVTVASAGIVDFAIEATLFTFSGPDTALVLANAAARLDAYLAESRLIGRDIPRSSLHAALTVPGVQRVELASPAADIVCTATQAAHCTAIAIGHGGYAS